MSPRAHLAKLGEALLAVGAGAELAVLAAPAGGDARVERGDDVVGEQRMVDHVAELVQTVRCTPRDP